MIFNKVVYVAAPKVQLAAPSDLIATPGTGKISLTWTDPEDIVRTGRTVATWEKTRIVRKEGAPPNDHNDGVIVVESTEKNQYQSTPYDDSTVQVGTVYHYGAFSYSEEGVWSEGAFVNATPMAGTPLGELAEGTLIKIQENGAPVEFYVAKQNYEEGLNGAGRALCVRKDVFDYRRWNDTEVNTWANSSMLSWLNSGYKMILGTNVQKMIATTTYRYTPGNGDKSVTTRADAVFLMSLTELGKSALYVNTEGSALPIAAILQTIPKPGPNQDGQWTRSPNTQYNSAAVNLGYTGLVSTNKYVTTDHYASRPCFTLPATALVDQDLNLIEEVSA